MMNSFIIFYRHILDLRIFSVSKLLFLSLIFSWLNFIVTFSQFLVPVFSFSIGQFILPLMLLICSRMLLTWHSFICFNHIQLLLGWFLIIWFTHLFLLAEFRFSGFFSN